MKLPISVTIITKNEEKRLPNALESVKEWADELIVVDSGSNDNTVTIAKKYGAKVFHKEWNGYGQQKIFAENQCRNDWILNIDADERVCPTLRKSIFKLFSKALPENACAFSMPCKLIYLGRKKPGLLAVQVEVVRLYNKNYAGFRNSSVHDSVILKGEGKVNRLKGALHHQCFIDVTHWINKINFYTTAQAQDWIDRNRAAPSIVRCLFEPLYSFFKSYFLRRYFLMGIDGFNASIIYAFSKTVRLTKIRELYRLKGES